MQDVFKDRKDAGRRLATALEHYKGKNEVIVLALVRGGVTVASEVCKLLKLPLDVVVARKVGAPYNHELGIGAIAGDISVYNEDLISDLGVSKEYIRTETERKKKEAEEKLKLYRSGMPPLKLKDKVVILVDDGIATGVSMYAAIKFVKAQGAKKVVVAVPVASPHTVKKMEREVDELICLHLPISMMAVGQFYLDFAQVEDDEVINLLKETKHG
jgi:putative phosphoribosyl transferase